MSLLTFDVVTVAKLASAFQLLMFALVNLAVIVMRESRIDGYDPKVRSPLYPWVQIIGIFVSFVLIVELGRLSTLFTIGMVGAGVCWFFWYANAKVRRRGALLHWFERLGRNRSEGLEREMREIHVEGGLRHDDGFAEIIGQAQFLDMPDEASFQEVADAVAAALAPRLNLEASAIAERFVSGQRSGLAPVEHGVLWN